MVDSELSQITSFFSEITTKGDNGFDYGRLAFVCCSEFGWSQSEFEETEIPFLFMILEERKKDIKRQNDEIKKQNRR